MKFRSLHDKPILKCVICQKDFEQQRWNQICCSSVCMIINKKNTQREGHKKWRIANREYYLAKMREYNLTHHEAHCNACKAYNKKVKESQ